MAYNLLELRVGRRENKACLERLLFRWAASIICLLTIIENNVVLTGHCKLKNADNNKIC